MIKKTKSIICILSIFLLSGYLPVYSAGPVNNVYSWILPPAGNHPNGTDICIQEGVNPTSASDCATSRPEDMAAFKCYIDHVAVSSTTGANICDSTGSNCTKKFGDFLAPPPTTIFLAKWNESLAAVKLNVSYVGATPALSNYCELQLLATNASGASVVGRNQGILNGGSSTSLTNGTNFGSQSVNGNGVSNEFNINNNSGSSLQVTKIEIEETTTQSTSRSLHEWMQRISWWNLLGINNALAVGAGDFTLDITGSPPYTINNGSSFSFNINFTPTAPGLRDGIVIVTFSDGSVFRFAISGNGTQATVDSSAQNIPVFGPLGLLAMLGGLLWFGNRRRNS